MIMVYIIAADGSCGERASSYHCKAPAHPLKALLQSLVIFFPKLRRIIVNPALFTRIMIIMHRYITVYLSNYASHYTGLI